MRAITMLPNRFAFWIMHRKTFYYKKVSNIFNFFYNDINLHNINSILIVCAFKKNNLNENT